MDPTPCNNYYQLGSKERKWIFPFNLFSRKYYSGPININERSNNKDKVVVEKSKFRVKLIMDYIVPIFDYIGSPIFRQKQVCLQVFVIGWMILTLMYITCRPKQARVFFFVLNYVII